MRRVQFVLIVLMDKDDEEEAKAVSFREVEFHEARYAGGLASILNRMFFGAYLLLSMIKLLSSTNEKLAVADSFVILHGRQLLVADDDCEWSVIVGPTFVLITGK